jgi:hypothetical protein
MSLNIPTSEPKPTSLWLNVFSIVRLLLGVIAGGLVSTGMVTGQPASSPQTVGGALMIIAVGAWHVYKNNTMVQQLISALQAPAVRLQSLLVGLLCVGLLIGSSPLLTACATTTNATAIQADTVAWAALDGVSITLDTLAKSGVLHGPQAATAAADLQTATQALQAADAAITASQNATAAQNVATATALITKLVTIAESLGVSVKPAPVAAIADPRHFAEFQLLHDLRHQARL